MNTHHIKEEVDKNVARLQTLRDEIKLHLHLASLDARKEWEETLSPKILELEGAARNISEPTRSKARELVTKMEDFLARLRPRH